MQFEDFFSYFQNTPDSFKSSVFELLRKHRTGYYPYSVFNLHKETEKDMLESLWNNSTPEGKKMVCLSLIGRKLVV